MISPDHDGYIYVICEEEGSRGSSGGHLDAMPSGKPVYEAQAPLNCLYQLGLLSPGIYKAAHMRNLIQVEEGNSRRGVNTIERELGSNSGKPL